MSKKSIGAILSLGLVLALGEVAFAQGDPAQSLQPPRPSPQTRPAGGLSLTLAECLERALKANLDLTIDAFSPEIAEASLRETREKYLPQFTLGSYYYDLTTPSTWGVEGPIFSNKEDSVSLRLRQNVSIGTVLDISVSSRRSDTTRAYTTINPSYTSQIRLDLTQPLLRNFGPKVNRYQTIKAERQRDMSLSSLKTTLLSTIYYVEQAYWNLYYSRENLRVQELSLAQSRETYKRTEEAVRIGSNSPIDLLKAETEVANYEDGLLSAQARLEKQENALKALLNIPVAPTAAMAAAASAEAIIPVDRPVVEKRRVTFDEALRTAFAERPELAQYESQMADAALDIGYSKNQLLPDLNLQLGYWNPGQSGVRYLFQDDNPLTGIIIGRIAGSRGDSFRDLFRNTYKNLSLNLTLSVPLANVLSRANLAKAKLAEEQARLRLEKQRQAIEVEIQDAVKDLETSARKIESSARFRALMEKQVEAETQRYQLGLAGSEWLFSYQRQLAQAKVSEIQAVVDYKIALANLDKAMGTTLKSKGLKFRDYAF
jgi:outer membrane protein TolC